MLTSLSVEETYRESHSRAARRSGRIVSRDGLFVSGFLFRGSGGGMFDYGGGGGWRRRAIRRGLFEGRRGAAGWMGLPHDINMGSHGLGLA